MDRLSKAALALVLIAAAGVAVAQYPVKPIRLVVGFPPGGSADPTTRIIGAALAEQMGQPVVVENRPGADSALAAEQVTRFSPDGYTIMFASNSAMTAAVALRKQPLYDPLTDFTPISMVGRATVFLYVHPAVPAATLKEFVEYARAHPGKLNYGTDNPLSILYNVQFMDATGISMVHVPYKGEGPLNPDILAGRVQSSFLSTGTAVSYAKEGRLRALAVLLERRGPTFPPSPKPARQRSRCASGPACSARRRCRVRSSSGSTRRSTRRSGVPTYSRRCRVTAMPRRARRPSAWPRSTATTSRCGAGSCARRASRWSSARAPWIRGSDI
jgi:tripartite-type tricarboxylate transporter receptor subunit TctC